MAIHPAVTSRSNPMQGPWRILVLLPRMVGELGSVPRHSVRTGQGGAMSFLGLAAGCPRTHRHRPSLYHIPPRLSRGYSQYGRHQIRRLFQLRSPLIGTGMRLM